MKVLIITGVHPTKTNPLAGIYITRMMQKLQQYGRDRAVGHRLYLHCIPQIRLSLPATGYLKLQKNWAIRKIIR